MKRFLVWFFDCDSTVSFDNPQDARHYARHNGGIVKDLETGETLYNYDDEEREA